ncbi:caspase family protein [Pararhizobium sp. PWRC1-1]|uniref:caspase family protein n=1 Tax=Pararhizobium sp. PWRC1-1 TaxID=2804566 RepID=UPI003CF34A43
MKARSLYIFLAALSAILVHPGPAAAVRHAAIISFSQYPWADLPGVRADRNIIMPILEEDFKVTLFGDNLRSKKEFRRAWFAFVETIMPQDDVVVYYSGHGIDVDGANFLIPLDSEAPNSSNIKLEYLKDDFILLRTLIEEVQNRDPRLSVFLLDACRTNPYASRGAGLSRKGLRPEAIERFGGYLIVLFSAEFNQEARDSMPNGDVNGGSPFALMFAKLYKDGKHLSLMAFFQLVSAAVQEAVEPEDQLPTMQGMVPPNWCFAECKGVPGQQIVIAPLSRSAGREETRRIVSQQTDIKNISAGISSDTMINDAIKKLGNVVFLGKLSERGCSANSASNDVPFGCEFLKQAMSTVSGQGAAEVFNRAPRAIYDVNIRRSPPKVEGKKAHYDCSVRILRQGEIVQLKAITGYQYADDTFLWGVVDAPQLDRCK